MVKIGNKAIPTWVIAYIVILVVAALAYIAFSRLKTVYIIKIAYVIEPEIQQLGRAPTISSNSDTLDLGTIASGSTGEKDFGKIATLYLPSGYREFPKLGSTDDFDDFDVWINFYEAGKTTGWPEYYVYKGITESAWWRSGRLSSTGDYNIYVKVRYRAKNVTTTTSGEVIIKLSWPILVKLP